jgi:ribosomal protein S27AE
MPSLAKESPIKYIMKFLVFSHNANCNSLFSATHLAVNSADRVKTMTNYNVISDGRKVFPNQNRRITCPTCGNDSEFLEVADGVILTTKYIQNDDNSFTQEGDESQILGEIRLYCGECNSDLTNFHQRFLEMLF